MKRHVAENRPDDHYFEAKCGRTEFYYGRIHCLFCVRQDALLLGHGSLFYLDVVY